MSLNPKPISKEWIKKKYWIEQLTAEEMAAVRKVKPTYIQDLICKYDLSKKKNGIKAKGKKNYIMPEKEKVKHRIQPHAKEIVAFKGINKKYIGSFRSINKAAIELNLSRANIRGCLNPKVKRNSVKGYTFEYKKYKGEIIIGRRESLDFTLEFEKVCNGLTAKLPFYPYEERINHYNKKLKKVFEDIRNKNE